jgi:hypothetical protein
VRVLGLLGLRLTCSVDSGWCRDQLFDIKGGLGKGARAPDEELSGIAVGGAVCEDGDVEDEADVS